MSDTRKYDILVWGATSFTGTRLVEYLALNSPPGTRVALGGRNKSKLEGVKQDLAAKLADVAIDIGTMDIVIGDSADLVRLREIVAQTKVVASTVGPYTVYGSELVRACVAEGADYCDITGEFPWVKQMHRELNDEAVRNNVHIASMCGFDCIPADLGCFMLAQYARDELNQPLQHVKGSIVGIRGGVSGGTLTTLVNQISVEKKLLWRKLKSMLRPNSVARGSAGREARVSGKNFQRGVIHYDETLQRWQTFWIMSMVNSQTAGWAGRTLNYGPGFSYGESMSARNLIHAVGIAVGLFYGLLLMMFGLTRNILYALKIVPRPGEGPSEEFTRRGFFSLHLEAFTPSGVVYGKVSGTSDPGYGETITYMGESALCLAFDRDGTFRPGVYPPSVIMGTALLSRLRNKGCQFDLGRAPIPAVGIASDEGSKKKQ
ncbi:hypothetical protein IW146_003169 [Coemansia sp. RSA 922]|nr:hypothetical protein H4S03_007241 [Coemansia sp. S3946]KAJ2051225.1 hypothetical protein H4S04_002112 [Coemansia sp. S16]KAJ2114346.1 hypothetical protein IW146_003169 [Coemansia sp. RSA 922]KAJ2353428.1 hypothetical protein GGH92_000666 [Coemansia sp. RSA 2673]